MWRTPFSTCHSIPMCGRSSAAVLQRARLRRGTLLPPHACGFRGGRDAGHLSPPLRALRRSDGARRPGAHSSDGGVRGWQLPHGAVPRARRGGNALVPGMGAGRGRLVSHRRHCAWFHVFDFACGQLQWLGLRSCRFHVGAGAFGAWLCLWEITRVFGKNNLVPTVTASFDVLEAGDMVEGCSSWVWFGFGGFDWSGILCRLAAYSDQRRGQLCRRFAAGSVAHHTWCRLC